MAQFNANFEVVNLSGTQNAGQLGDGITASSIHRVYCLSAGAIIITPLAGPAFTFTATANLFIDVLVKSTTVSSGTFIGFKSKFNPVQFFSGSGPYLP